jgi:hypothetical protein
MDASYHRLRTSMFGNLPRNASSQVSDRWKQHHRAQLRSTM